MGYFSENSSIDAPRWRNHIVSCVVNQSDFHRHHIASLDSFDIRISVLDIIHVFQHPPPQPIPSSFDRKGPEYFIEAAKMVLNKMNTVRFVMAGSGDMMNAMVSRVSELGIADRFHFTGFLKGNDVSQMFEMTDVFVMPSVSEPFGIVPLEAMRAGVPVIISNQSGVAEILENAIKIDFWDTFAMADAIYGLLSYPSLAQFFKEQGIREVGNLKWKNSAEQVQKVYQSALNL